MKMKNYNIKKYTTVFLLFISIYLSLDLNSVHACENPLPLKRTYVFNYQDNSHQINTLNVTENNHRNEIETITPYPTAVNPSRTINLFLSQKLHRLHDFFQHIIHLTTDSLGLTNEILNLKEGLQ